MTVIAREGIRGNPLPLTDGIEHRFYSVQLPAGIFIKTYVDMSIMGIINK